MCHDLLTSDHSDFDSYGINTGPVPEKQMDTKFSPVMNSAKFIHRDRIKRQLQANDSAKKEKNLNNLCGPVSLAAPRRLLTLAVNQFSYFADEK